jgi:hypothetical protein
VEVQIHTLSALNVKVKYIKSVTDPVVAQRRVKV